MTAGVVFTGDVAAMLGISRRTIERWRRSGRFPFVAVQVGSRRGYSRAAVERYINSNVGTGRRFVNV